MSPSSITFVTNLWILLRSTLFIVPIVKKNGFSWCWGKEQLPVITWCYVRYFCVYCKGCKILCFMWVHPYFFIIYLCLHMSGLTCDFNGWWMLFDVIIANPTCTYLISHVALSHRVIVTIVIHVKDNLYYDNI